MTTDLVHIVFAVCWIAILAFTGVFSYAFIKWALYAIWPIKTIKVNYYHNGKLQESRTLDLGSDEFLVRQIRDSEKESRSER